MSASLTTVVLSFCDLVSQIDGHASEIGGRPQWPPTTGRVSKTFARLYLRLSLPRRSARSTVSHSISCMVNRTPASFTFLQGTGDGSRRRGRDNIKQWTGQSLSSLLCIADDSSRWATITVEASVGASPLPLTTPGRRGCKFFS